MTSTPKVTVLMPVYNNEKYLKEAIDSILNQTFKDFELIAIDDGSTDKSIEIIKSFDDPRIKLVININNTGLAVTLNKGLDLAQSEYIVRMDGDDISLPERLEKQVKFMDQNPDIGLCGSWLKTIGTKNHHIWKYSDNSNRIKASMFFQCPFAHPTVIIRNSILKTNNIHMPETFPYSEDYHLWMQLAKYTNFSNIQEILLLYRRYNNQTSSTHYEIQQEYSKDVRLIIMNEIGINPTDEENELHNSLIYRKFWRTKEYIIKVENWLNKLMNANTTKNVYSEIELRQIFGERWFLACRKSSGLGFWSWNKYWQSELSHSTTIPRSKLFLFWLTCFLRING